MAIMEIVFSAVFNILSIYIGFRVIRLFLPRKEKYSIYPQIVYTGVWLVNLLVFFLFNNVLLTISSLVIGMLLAAFLLYEGSPIRKIVAVITAVAMGMVSENLVWIFLGQTSGLQTNAALGSLFSSFLYILLVIVIEKFVNVKQTDRISSKSYFNIFVVIFGSIVLGEILVRLGKDDQRLALVGLSVICLINVSTFYIYDKINEVYSQKLERESMKQRMVMYENQMELMEQSQKNIRMLQHDMRNHLLLIQSYLDHQDYEKGRQYIAEISQYMDIPGQYCHSGNQEIDAILNYIIDRAKKKSCQVETDIQVPNDCFMAKMDLNILLSNLLNNALEAMEKVEEKYLFIGMKYQNGIFVIQIANSYDGKVIRKGEHFITRKKDKDNHGLGLRNICEIVEKYQGEQRIETTDERFQTTIMLCTQAAQN